METNGVLGCVNISKETRDEIAEDFYCQEREPIHIKGKGIMISYLVTGPKHTLGGVPPLPETGKELRGAIEDLSFKATLGITDPTLFRSI